MCKQKEPNNIIFIWSNILVWVTHRTFEVNRWREKNVTVKPQANEEPSRGYNLEEYMWLYVLEQNKKLRGGDRFWALVKLLSECTQVRF